MEDCVKTNMSETPKKHPDLYKKLKSEFQNVIDTVNFVDVFSNDIWIKFVKSSDDHSRSYDMVKNFSALEEFLAFHNFVCYKDMIHFARFYTKDIEILIYGDCCKYGIYIALSIITNDKCNEIIKYFNKIYDLIDYLKDYFNLHNKVAIRE